MTSSRTVRAVRDQLDHTDHTVRAESLTALGELLRAADEVPTEQIAKCLGDHRWEVRLAAGRLAARLGRRLVCDSIMNRLEALLQLGGTNGAEVVAAAVQAIEQMGPAGRVPRIFGQLVDLLFSGDREVAQQACGTLGRMGEEPIRLASSRFVGMLRSSEDRTRRKCLSSLLQVQHRACWPPFVHELTRLLDEPEARLRAMGAAGLEWLGPGAADTDILARLEELKADRDGDVKLYATYALTRLRAPVPE